MPTAQPTNNFACDRALKAALVAGVPEDLQPVLREIFRRADRLAFMQVADRQEAIRDLEAYCKEQPCIPWASEERSRHVVVRIYKRGESVISVARAVWACVHVVSQQGEQLGSEEELHHTCAKNGNQRTGHGACINPAHLIRGDHRTGIQLRDARAKLDRILKRGGIQ